MTTLGVQSPDFWEEVYILERSMTDFRLGEAFAAGDCVCHPPGMPDGPWISETDCRTVEVRLARFATAEWAKRK